MKRFVAVETHVRGRTITRVYPARTVATSHEPNHFWDDQACKACGYVVCSCPEEPVERSRPCCTAAARGAACACLDDYTTRYLARPPLIDVLPLGWSLLGATYLRHETGALVRKDPPVWRWWASLRAPGYSIECNDPKPTRDEAMQAALGEEVLPEGWHDVHGDVTVFEHECGARVGVGNPGGAWFWKPNKADRYLDYRHCATRDEAMAAALASVQPAEPYGCVRRQGMSPRECVESGHYWCHFNTVPAVRVLRPGWEIRGKFMGEPDYWFGDFNVCSSAGSDGNDGDWSVCNERGHELWRRPTLEAAMERAEELARGES